jgi:hypothetical protein
MNQILTLTVHRSPLGTCFVTCAEHKGLLTCGADLTDALADVPRALAGALAAGAVIPTLDGVKLGVGDR